LLGVYLRHRNRRKYRAMTEIKRIGVIGAGQMGRGIAQASSSAGFLTTLSDVNEATAQAGKDQIANQLERLVGKGKLGQAQRGEILERIIPIHALEGHADSSIVIEAATENEDLKAKIFKGLDEVLPTQVILATNTPSISVTRLAGITTRADRVIGMHFMNPVPVMKLVEIIRGIGTSEETYRITSQLAQAMGKTVVTSADYPGFVVNRILMPMLNEAAFALMEGVASAEDIDAAMKLGTNQPMGPLTLADFIGLDTCLAIMEVLYEGMGDPKYRPCPLLRRMVDSGRLGRKVGRGFHNYE